MESPPTESPPAESSAQDAPGPEASVQDLFKRWRNEGDPDAGMAMAQKFSDWYYAVTAARLGDRNGREPLEAACQAFEQGIVRVTRTSDLVDWAYGLVQTNLIASGSRVPGGDFPNALTGNRSPTALLQVVRPQLDSSQVHLLAMTFDPTVDLDTLSQVAEDAGGMPHAILQARYQLKRVLVAHAQIPLQVVPQEPNLDLAPLPMYEAARMESDDEEAAFEKWLLSDIELCKDVAEFATFAHALRGGAFSGEAVPVASAQLSPSPPNAAPSAASSAAAQPSPVPPGSGASLQPKTGSKLPLIIGGIVVGIIVSLLILAVVALSFMR